MKELFVFTIGFAVLAFSGGFSDETARVEATVEATIQSIALVSK